MNNRIELSDFCREKECPIMKIHLTANKGVVDYEKIKGVCRDSCGFSGQEYFDWLIVKDCQFKPFKIKELKPKGRETAYQCHIRLDKKGIELTLC